MKSAFCGIGITLESIFLPAFSNKTDEDDSLKSSVTDPLTADGFWVSEFTLKLIYGGFYKTTFAGFSVDLIEILSKVNLLVDAAVLELSSKKLIGST